MNVSFRALKITILGFAFAAVIPVAHAQQTANDFFKISQKALTFKDYDNVIFFCNKALALNPKYGAAYWNRAIAYDRKGAFDKSIDDYSSAIVLYDDPQDLATLHKNRGMVFNSKKKYDSAIMDFNKALDLNPDYNFAYWNMGIAYDGKRLPDSAAYYYTKAIALFQPGNDQAQLYILRGMDYAMLHKNGQSDSDYREAIKIAPEPGYYSVYANYLLGEKEKAAAMMKQWQDKAKSKPAELKSAYFDMAGAYAAMKDEENTLKYLELAFKNGYNDFLYVQGDKDFDFVRTNPAYPALIKKYNVK